MRKGRAGRSLVPEGGSAQARRPHVCWWSHGEGAAEAGAWAGDEGWRTGLGFRLSFLTPALFWPLLSLQVRKAVEALLAFARSKAKGDALLLNENESVHLLVTVWKIPRVAQVIKM